uniref:Uncharacterized protein n=1 Tax=Timema cristinae TaxID=61476 RepID=A0A7R9CDX3_TIMCR|nr:unnamed protein product [Timema cristinae]
MGKGYLQVRRGVVIFKHHTTRPLTLADGCWEHPKGSLSHLLIVWPSKLYNYIDNNEAMCEEKHSELSGGRLWLYMKLFSLMGVTWLTEIISWAVGGPSYYWYVTDIVNILRAVFVFIIFCCKRTTLNIICIRLHGLIPCCTTAPVMNYGKENSSSQRTGSMQLTVFNNARKTSSLKTEIQNSIQPSS